MRIVSFLKISSMAAAAVVLSTATSLAAPQALGLIATNGNVDLKCVGNGCTAEFTTFCLQKDRASPDRGTAYLISSGKMMVSALTKAGTRIELDPDKDLVLQSRRKHMALHIALPQSTVDRLDLASVSIDVKENVVLIPQTIAGDPTPHSQQEIAMLGQSMRQIGTSMIDADPDRTAATRVLNKMINELPEKQKVAPSTRDKVWQNAVHKSGEGLSKEGFHRAKGVYRLCKWKADRETPNMRSCLQEQHDKMIKFLNSKYWKYSNPIY